MAIPWNPEHEAILTRPGMTIVEAARLTGRTTHAVRQKAAKMGVTLYLNETAVTPNMPPEAQNWHESDDSPEDESFIAGARSRERGEDIAEYWAAMKQLMAVQVRRRQGIRNLSYSLGEEPVGIVLMSDLHIGAMIDAEQLERDVQMIAETDGLYCILLGDVLENAKPHGKAASSMFSTVIPSPKDQFEIAKMVLEPLRGKCLAFLEGNHESRDYKTAGIDRLPALAEHLNAPYVTEAGASLKLNVGAEAYRFHVKHQWGGASRINKSNPTRRMWEEYPEFESADLVAIGHFHEPDYHRTRKRGEWVHLVKLGAYKVLDGYSDALGFASAYGVGVAVLDPDRHDVAVEMSLPDGVRRLQSYRSSIAA